MWSIGECKSRAWNRLRIYVWPAVLVMFAYGLLGGGSGVSATRASLEERREIVREFANLPYEMLMEILFTAFGIMALVSLVIIILKVFITNPVEVGVSRFFMESREREASAGAGKAFWVFGSGHYMNVVKIMFLRDLYTFLWTLLLIIPGIVKAYEYAMIPYILSENPEANYKDAFAISRDMMRDSKFQLFLLQLSFIGWYLLLVVAIYISVFILAWIPIISYFSILLVIPALIGALMISAYEAASEAEVYAQLRENITGYPFNGFGVWQDEPIDG